MSFLPENYKVPNSDAWNFTKFQKWDTKIRVLPGDPTCIVWYEYFSQSGGKVTPIRSKVPFTTTKWIRDWESPKHFWAFKVYNYTTGRSEICEITQKSIMNAILAYVKHEDYWDPTSYDITITREGEWLDTKYSIVAWVPKNIAIEYEDINVDWDAFILWDNPFVTDMPF